MYKYFTPRNYGRLLEWIVATGEVVSPNGEKTVEVLNAPLLLRDPRDRIIINQNRKVNLAFGVAEWLGILMGEARVSFFQTYISNYDKYSSDGIYVDGAYGPRIVGEIDQIEKVIELLGKDKNSRRAVISFYDGKIDLNGGGGVNTPCTLSMQFIVRENKLHSIVTMRSNDIVWGLTYDLFVFTMIQEYVARRLGLILGRYYHNAGSLHLYERHFSMADDIIAQPENRWTIVMQEMPAIGNVELIRLWNLYTDPFNVDNEDLISRMYSQFAKNLGYLALAFINRKSPDLFEKYYKLCTDYTIRKTLRPWATDQEN